jgi:hypothetical protein
MTVSPRQRLRVLSVDLTVELLPVGHPVPEGAWSALVRAPEGLTVIREAPVAPGAEDGAERWAGLYGENAHELDVPGMLAGLLVPLAGAGVPVFVASTFHSDLVLVPVSRLGEAREALHAAGHEVVGDR